MTIAREKRESVDTKQEDTPPTNAEKADAKSNHFDAEKADAKSHHSDAEKADAKSNHSDAEKADAKSNHSDAMKADAKSNHSGAEKADAQSNHSDAEKADAKSNNSDAEKVEQVDSEPQDEADVVCPQHIDTQAQPELQTVSEEPIDKHDDSESHTVSEQVDSQSAADGVVNSQQLGEENVNQHDVSSEHVDTDTVNSEIAEHSQPDGAEVVHLQQPDAGSMGKEVDYVELKQSSDTGEPVQAETETMDAKLTVVEVHSEIKTVSELADSQPMVEGVARSHSVGEEDVYQDPVSLEHTHANSADSLPTDKHVDCQFQTVHVPADSSVEQEHSNHVNADITDSQPSAVDMVHSQPEDTQPMDLEQADGLHNHPDIVKPEQGETIPMDTETANTQPMDEHVHSQSHTVSDIVSSQHMDVGLAHPRPLGEEDIYSHPIRSDHLHLGVDSQTIDGQNDLRPMSDDGLSHPRPLGEDDIYSHPISSEHLHSHQMSSDLVHLQSETADIVYTQPVSSELVHLSTVNVEPVHLQPVGMELVNSHAIDMELVNTEPLSTEVPNSQQVTPETQPNKRRKKKSIVWEHFTIETVSAGCRRACCKVCKQSFAYSTGSKVAGTSHLKRHIAKGTCPVILRQQEKNQLTPYMPKSEGGTDTVSNPPKRRYRSSSAPYLIFDQDRCRHEIARMIIMHDYPLHMVEHPGFVSFVQNLQPRFDMVSFNIVQGDCVATFLREKQNLQRFIEGIPGRICLTLDMWTSSYSTGYVFVTGQFIDNDWKLHRRLLNVVMEPFPESDTALSHAIGTCLSDWGVDRKLASLTFNQPLSETGLENLRALLAAKNPLVLNGQLLIRNCIARTLSSMAQDVLEASQETIKKIRGSVKYVKTSESHEEKFMELKQQLQVPSEKSLCLDNTTKWNTTYEMLLAASEMKEVFSCLDTSDPDYKDAPSMEDWKQVENICMYLKLMFDTANMLTVKGPQSTNMFFHEVWKIQLELARAAASDDLFVSGLARPLQDRFHKYWKNSCLILAIAVAMDPRFKMKLVEFSFTKIFGEEAPIYIRVVDDGIHELFHEYMKLPLPLIPAFAEDGSGANVKAEYQQEGNLMANNGLSDFDMYIMETSSQQMKSELDQYLEESLLPRVQDFDVLGWWKLNKLKYPTLSKMARDILSIPISTVPPESVFDTVGKEMDSYRCSLRPETVEALICAKDWLQQESSKCVTEPVKMEQL